MSPKNRHDSLIIAAVVLAALVVLAYYFMGGLSGNEVVNINSFEECAAAQGGRVVMTYPEMCTTPNGRTFTKQYGDVPVDYPAGNSEQTNFNECELRGYPIMESYPRKCSVPGGDSFTEILEPISGKSGVRGVVAIGPTCPVVRDPAPPECADRPYAAKLKITRADSEVSIEKFESYRDGTFEVELAPGIYEIKQADAGSVRMPFLAPVRFTVEQGAWTNLTVIFDSGIR
ncbi:MAG: hypothetical protein V1856_03500 [Candidatus Liptonbacteria bacterium]